MVDRGEFLAAKHAEPVYALFGKKGLGEFVIPGLLKITTVKKPARFGK